MKVKNRAPNEFLVLSSEKTSDELKKLTFIATYFRFGSVFVTALLFYHPRAMTLSDCGSFANELNMSAFALTAGNTTCSVVKDVYSLFGSVVADMTVYVKPGLGTLLGKLKIDSIKERMRRVK